MKETRKATEILNIIANHEEGTLDIPHRKQEWSQLHHNIIPEVHLIYMTLWELQLYTFFRWLVLIIMTDVINSIFESDGNVRIQG